MTPDEYRAYVCGRKVPFATYAEARHNAKRLNREVGEMVASYHCKFGDHWHVGHHYSKKARRAYNKANGRA